MCAPLKDILTTLMKSTGKLFLLLSAVNSFKQSLTRSELVGKKWGSFFHKQKQHATQEYFPALINKKLPPLVWSPTNLKMGSGPSFCLTHNSTAAIVLSPTVQTYAWWNNFFFGFPIYLPHIRACVADYLSRVTKTIQSVTYLCCFSSSFSINQLLAETILTIPVS